MSAALHADAPEAREGLGGLGTGPVPLDPYRSTSFFETERDNIFRRAWLLLGRVEELPSPGDFVVKAVEIADVSVLLARGKDGQVRAFHNVCPHRANQLVWKTEGSVPVFVCRYHNWTFATDGTLRGIPDQEMFVDVDKASCGLKSIALDVWDGFIFVNLAAQPELTLSEFLGGVKDRLSGIDYINADNPMVIETILNCNWKVVADAFSEAYHIPAIHPASLKPMFSNSSNPFGRLLDVKFSGPHASNSMFGNSEYLPTPTQAVEILAYNPAHLAPGYIEDLGRFRSHRAVNPTREANWSMDVNYIFPNTHIDANAGGFFVHQFWPIDVNRTRHEARFYARKPATIRERFVQEHGLALTVDIILEDLSNVERTQRGINSRGTDSMQISKSEVLIRHSVHHVRKWAAAPTVAEAMARETAA